jgi:UDPglucose--hexose-1-phosphate uridylyltransferase
VSALHTQRLEKPDGRALWLYARAPLSIAGPAPVPPGERGEPRPHLRWHPLLGEWIAYAGHRQNRTFLPPATWDPLGPTKPGATATELPEGPWEAAVFENRFPTLSGASDSAPKLFVETRPARGTCEVVVFGPEPTGSLGTLSVSRIELLLDVWAHRTAELGARDDVLYVFAFENRGVEVGVTLPHPHGQIYAYPFVPPIAQRQLAQQRAHYELHGTGLLAQCIEREIADGRRMLYESDEAAAFVPVCARWAYEIWVAPRRSVPSFIALERTEKREVARALKTALAKLDGLFGVPMPYILAFHQAPSDGLDHPEAHLHAEIYPGLRMPGRLKFLAGSETGAGVFTADTFPEEKAEELRRVEVSLG